MAAASPEEVLTNTVHNLTIQVKKLNDTLNATVLLLGKSLQSQINLKERIEYLEKQNNNP